MARPVAPTRADRLALRDPLAPPHDGPREMEEGAGQPHAVADDDEIAFEAEGGRPGEHDDRRRPARRPAPRRRRRCRHRYDRRPARRDRHAAIRRLPLTRPARRPDEGLAPAVRRRRIERAGGGDPGQLAFAQAQISRASAPAGRRAMPIRSIVQARGATAMSRATSRPSAGAATSRAAAGRRDRSRAGSGRRARAAPACRRAGSSARLPAEQQAARPARRTAGRRARRRAWALSGGGRTGRSGRARAGRRRRSEQVRSRRRSGKQGRDGHRISLSRSAGRRRARPR